MHTHSVSICKRRIYEGFETLLTHLPSLPLSLRLVKKMKSLNFVKMLLQISSCKKVLLRDKVCSSKVPGSQEKISGAFPDLVCV